MSASVNRVKGDKLSECLLQERLDPDSFAECSGATATPPHNFGTCFRMRPPAEADQTHAVRIVSFGRRQIAAVASRVQSRRRTPLRILLLTTPFPVAPTQGCLWLHGACPRYLYGFPRLVGS